MADLTSARRTCVVTLYRQTTLPVMDLTDVTASGLLAFLASTIEIAVAISIACLPFLRALWKGAASSRQGGSGGGSHHFNSGGSSGLNFGRKSLKSDGFGQLPDDSSEIRLHPIERKRHDATCKISADTGAMDEEAYSGAETGLVVKVETEWNVESMPAGTSQQRGGH